VGSQNITVFLCLWDSRDTKNHYTTKKWPERGTYVVREKNVKYSTFVEPYKILVIVPPLHVRFDEKLCRSFG
jgi:hypothetical protein